MDHLPNPPTARRTILIWFGNSLVIGTAAGCSTIGDAFKVSKMSAQYQDMPKDMQSCSRCKYFVAPNGCHQVQGMVSPTGWCRYWSVKT